MATPTTQARARTRNGQTKRVSFDLSGKKALAPAAVEESVKETVRPARVGKRAINFYLDTNVWMQVQLLAVQYPEGKQSIQSLMEEATGDLLAKYTVGKRS